MPGASVAFGPESPVHPPERVGSRFFYALVVTRSALVERYNLQVGMDLGTDSCWYKAIVIGFLSITFFRSKLLSLKENRVLGLDVLYTRWRDACIDRLITATLVKQRTIRMQYRDRFIDDKNFTKDFGDLVLEKMEHSKAKEIDIGILRDTMDSPVPNKESLSVIHEAIIKSALLYMSRRELKDILKYWSQHKKPEGEPPPSGNGGEVLKSCNQDNKPLGS